MQIDLLSDVNIIITNCTGLARMQDADVFYAHLKRDPTPPLWRDAHGRALLRRISVDAASPLSFFRWWTWSTTGWAIQPRLKFWLKKASRGLLGIFQGVYKGLCPLCWKRRASVKIWMKKASREWVVRENWQKKFLGEIWGVQIYRFINFFKIREVLRVLMVCDLHLSTSELKTF